MDNLKNIVNAGHSRRGFITGVGTLGVAATLAGCGTDRHTKINPKITDADILNFALNLEYLEAEFYLRAATGQGLSAADIGANPGVVTGGSQVSFPNATLQQYAFEIAQDELNHVRFLRQALGSAAVDRPAIDLLNSFNGLAVAAGIGNSFNPFADSSSFELGAFVFEDVGVTAYHGAAGLLTSKAYLTAAAGIMAVEAYHAAEVRALIYAESVAVPSSPFLGYANKVSALRATLGGGNETMISATSIVAADTTNAIAFERTTDQVLHIVYAAGAGVVTKGGFFPNGMNGTIKATAA